LGDPAEPTQPEKNCECPAGTEHKYDEKKRCKGTDCACRIYYGEFVGLTFNGENVKVYKGSTAVADDQVNATVIKFQTAFDKPENEGGQDNSQRSSIINKIKEIHITDIMEIIILTMMTKY
jgi:hypothetical protein